MNNRFRNETIALLIISFSILSYELLIIRIISVIYEYDLLFIIISLSVCGLGIGGILYYNFSFSDNKAKSLLCLSLFCFPLSFTFSLWTLINHFFQITLAGSILVILIPFLIGGVLVSSIFANNPHKSSLLYFYDLLGGACGCLLSIPVMQYLGGINSIIGIGIIASIVVIILDRKTLRWLPLLFAVVIFLTNVRYNYIDIGEDKLRKTDTPLGQTLNYPGLKSEWISSTWDIYSRCDLVKASKGDIKRSIFINGGTKATMMRFDNNEETKKAINRYMSSSILFFPYLFDNNNTVLNIGSGGGRDVLMALLSGASEITAVEINKGVINMVMEQKDYNGNIYGFENVRLIIEDGRTFIMRTKENYDRIVLSLASTFAFSDMSSMAQMENYLYTKEAFREYLRHLTDNGTVIIFIDFSELVEKFIMTALEVLTEEYNIGYDRAMDYISAFETEYVSGYGYVFMMKKNPYSKETVERLNAMADGFGLVKVYIPYTDSGNDFDLIAKGELTPKTYIENNSANLRPSTDNSPFFLEVVFQYRMKLIILLTSITVLILLVIIFFQTGLIRSISSSNVSSLNLMSSRSIPFIPYFIFIGAGFMLVEILLTKRFSFYLGYPHLNIAIILFTVLIGTGVGSLISGMIKMGNIKKYTGLASLLLIAALTAFELTHNIFIKTTINLPLTIRALIIVFYLLPVSTLLGFFFPSGMRMAGDICPGHTAWLWGINGIASVMGSAASIVIAMSYGFHAVLYTAMSLYAGVALLLFSQRRAL